MWVYKSWISWELGRTVTAKMAMSRVNHFEPIDLQKPLGDITGTASICYSPWEAPKGINEHPVDLSLNYGMALNAFQKKGLN